MCARNDRYLYNVTEQHPLALRVAMTASMATNKQKNAPTAPTSMMPICQYCTHVKIRPQVNSRGHRRVHHFLNLAYIFHPICLKQCLIIRKKNASHSPQKIGPWAAPDSRISHYLLDPLFPPGTSKKKRRSSFPICSMDTERE